MLYLIVFRIFFWELLLVAILGAITAALGYSGPLFIKQIMYFIRTPKPTH